MKLGNLFFTVFFSVLFVLPLAMADDAIWINPECFNKRGAKYSPVIDYAVDVKGTIVVVDAFKSYSPVDLPVNFEWDLDGDRVYETKGAVVMHKFSSKEPEVVIGLRVRDKCGNTNEIRRIVELEVPGKKAEANEKPKAAFYVKMIRSNLIVDASNSFDPEGNIVKYEWDWNNDGSFEDEGILSSHYYSEDGLKTVALRVTDKEGLTDVKTRTISFKKPSPPEVSISPTGRVSQSFWSGFEKIFSFFSSWL